jgi:hydroxyacyl-ACP dehydratase HTD2-like protein with hotdog domain
MSIAEPRFFETVTVGTELPTVTHLPDAVQLFRFSAATWNAHRIHFDQDYARQQEGYPDILVQSHLHGALLLQTVTRWAGPHGRVRGYGWTNRRYSVPGQRLSCSGEVVATYLEDGAGLVRCELAERLEDGEVSVPGWAIVELPRREGGS